MLNNWQDLIFVLFVAAANKFNPYQLDPGKHGGQLQLQNGQ